MRPFCYLEAAHTHLLAFLLELERREKETWPLSGVGHHKNKQCHQTSRGFQRVGLVPGCRRSEPGGCSLSCPPAVCPLSESCDSGSFYLTTPEVTNITNRFSWSACFCVSQNRAVDWASDCEAAWFVILSFNKFTFKLLHQESPSALSFLLQLRLLWGEITDIIMKYFLNGKNITWVHQWLIFNLFSPRLKFCFCWSIRAADWLIEWRSFDWSSDDRHVRRLTEHQELHTRNSKRNFWLM